MTSFAPKDFTAGKWDGGAATITDPHFTTREFDTKDGKKTNVCLRFEYLDLDGQTHRGQFDVGNAEYVNVRESADEGADEAENGPAIGSAHPDKDYKVSASSEFGIFMAALVSAGFSEAKLADGDIGAIDGLQVEVVPKPRKEGDRFPLLLPAKLLSKTGSSKTGSKAAAKPAAGKKSAASDEASDAATAVVLEVLAEADGAVPTADVLRAAMKKYKGQDVKNAVVTMLSSKEFLGGSDAWVYDAEDKTLTAV